MFFGYLSTGSWGQDLFYRHATVYRAMTVEEYSRGIIHQRMAHEEFDIICRHRNRASRQVDIRAMAYTAELFDYIERLPRLPRMYSGWEYRRRAKKSVVYMAALAK